MSNDNLPPLPAHKYCLNSSPVMEGYTADQVRQCMRDAVAASGAGVPDGWRLVPIEPTDDMVLGPGALRVDGKVAHIHRNIWSRMLAAAPTPDRATKAEAAPGNAGEEARAWFAKKSSFGPWLECSPFTEGARLFVAATEAPDLGARDAARYQFLREHAYIEITCASPRHDGFTFDRLDAAVDEAIAAIQTKGE